MPTPGELITQNGTTVGGYDSTGKAAYFGGPPAPTTTAVAPVAAPTTTVSTSDPARNSYSAIEAAINQFYNNTPAVPGSPTNSNLSDGQAMLEARRTELQMRRDKEIERLGREFDSAATSQKQGQRSETGTSSMGLARIGGFDSASGQAVLTNLQRVHEGEQQDLLNKRQAAIAQAQNAYNDKDFELARLQLQDARDSEKLIYDRQKDFINLSLQLRGEQRADLNSQLQQSQFEYGKQRDKLQDQRQATEFAMKHQIGTGFYFVGGIGYDTSTGEALSKEEYIARGGDPNFKNNVTVIEPGSELERQFVVDLANKYPDAPIDIKNDDVATARSRIAGSKIYQDQVRPPSSGSGDSKSALMATFLSSAKSVLDAQRQDSKDGKVNPDTYRENKAAYISVGGNATDWFQMFPPEVYIAPENRKGDLDVYKSSGASADDLLIEQFNKSLGITPIK